MKELNNSLVGKWFITNKPLHGYDKNYIFKTNGLSEDYLLSPAMSIHIDDLDSINLLEDPLYMMDIQVDDEVTLTRDYNTLKKGDLVKVNEFFDSEKTKFITSGIMPGGFIYVNDVTKPIDYTNLRFRTFAECCVEFGISILFNSNRLPKKVAKALYGKQLVNVNIKNNHSYFIHGDYTIPGYYITKKPLVEKKYEVILRTEEEWNACVGKYSASNFIETAKQFKAYWTKPIKELLGPTYSGYTHEQIINTIIDNGGIRDKRENVIDSNMIELIELK